MTAAAVGVNDVVQERTTDTDSDRTVVVSHGPPLETIASFMALRNLINNGSRFSSKKKVAISVLRQRRK